MEPPLARRKFQTIRGCVARDRVNINYRSWKEFTGAPRDALLTEIMKHFSVHEGWIDDVKPAALCKARDA
jgi:hypothetical protein